MNGTGVVGSCWKRKFGIEEFLLREKNVWVFC